MKKIISLILCLALCLCFAPAAFAGAETAMRSKQSFTVNESPVDCEMYNIDGYNYFKLRDIALLLNGTEAQFSVGWDEAKQIVTITTGEAYIPVGGELEPGEDKAGTARSSPQIILINGEAAEGLTVYNIGGNNYFKLRDLGDRVGYAVAYDEKSNTAAVSSPRLGTPTDPVPEAEVSVWVCTRETRASTYENNEVRYTYDENGRLLSADGVYTDMQPSVIRFKSYSCSYDEQGRLTEVCLEDRAGNSRKDSYDGEGRLLRREYTQNGQVTGLIRSYDEAGRLLTEETLLADGGRQVFHSYVYECDKTGLLLREYDCYTPGSEISYSYNGDGRLIASEKADGSQRITYSYDAEGRLLCTTTMEGGSVKSESCTYDAEGKKDSMTTSYTSPQSSWYISYDGAGRELKRAGQMGDYSEEYRSSYDAEGRLTRRAFKNSRGETGAVSYKYDEAGRLSRESDGSYEIVYSYDEQGRPVKEAMTENFSSSVTEYSYDEAGNLLSEKTGYNGSGASEGIYYEYRQLQTVIVPGEAFFKLYGEELWA